MKDTAKFLNRPMVQWEKIVNAMPTPKRMELSDALAHLATHAARASAYIERRHTGGKHKDAVASQNRAARRVRQALGYTYADDAITF